MLYKYRDYGLYFEGAKNSGVGCYVVHLFNICRSLYIPWWKCPFKLGPKTLSCHQICWWRWKANADISAES